MTLFIFQTNSLSFSPYQVQTDSLHTHSYTLDTLACYSLFVLAGDSPESQQDASTAAAPLECDAGAGGAAEAVSSGAQQQQTQRGLARDKAKSMPKLRPYYSDLKGHAGRYKVKYRRRVHSRTATCV
jgi:hypothetical protein